MSYITRLGLTLTFDARLSVCMWQSDLMCMVNAIGYSQVKFWHAHMCFNNILAGYSFGTQAWA